MGRLIGLPIFIFPLLTGNFLLWNNEKYLPTSSTHS